MAFISISIDLSGSTEVKKTIRNFSSKDKDNISLLYTRFIEQLYLLEMKFYESLVNNQIELKNLFVVKTIGDEIWIIYDLSKDKVKYDSLEFNKLIYNIIYGLIYMIMGNNHIIIRERQFVEEEKYDFEKQAKVKSKKINIIPKVFIDLIEEYEETSNIRYKIFERMFDKLIPYTEQGALSSSDQINNFQEYLNNLNFGTQMGGSGNNKFDVSYRFDPIGFEVDRFFRLTKFSQPGVVTIGQNLYSKLLVNKLSETTNEIGYIESFVFPYGDKYFQRVDYFQYIFRKIDNSTLKGIDENYYLFYFFKHFLLPEELTNTNKDCQKHYKEIKDIFKELNVQLYSRERKP